MSKPATDEQISVWEKSMKNWGWITHFRARHLPRPLTSSEQNEVNRALIARIRQEQEKWWECDGCGFEMHKQHVTPGMGCPCCDDDPILRAEVVRLRTALAGLDGWIREHAREWDDGVYYVAIVAGSGKSSLSFDPGNIEQKLKVARAALEAGESSDHSGEGT